MKKRQKLSIRVNLFNTFHHIWNNNGTWWCNYTVHYDDHTSERIRVSLKTRDSKEAMRLRDLLLEGANLKDAIKISKSAQAKEDLAWEKINSDPRLPADHPIFKEGWVI